MKTDNPSYHICKHLIDKALGAESSDPLVNTWKAELSSLQTTCTTNEALLEVLSLTVAILKATAAEAASEGDVKRRKSLEEASFKASAIAFSLTSNMSEEDYIQRAELEYSSQELDILQQTVSVLLESNPSHTGVTEMASNLEKLSNDIDKREKNELIININVMLQELALDDSLEFKDKSFLMKLSFYLISSVSSQMKSQDI